MVAGQGTILRLLDGADKKFVIPVYQRAYSWKKDNCKELLKDLMTVFRQGHTSHFFGSIVYVENDIAGCNEYSIIDGQQRLTTVSLLLLAIRNFIVDNDISIEGINEERIMYSYLTDRYSSDETGKKLRLVQNGETNDDDAYGRLIERVEPIKESNVTVNYDFFYDEISKLNECEFKGLYDSITKLIIVNVSLNPAYGDNPQLIFESLNSTGLDLDESDKVRNYVLMGLEERRQRRIYRDYWEQLENKTSKEELAGFIRYYLAVKTRDLPAEDKIYRSFKTFRNEKNATDIETILQDMLDYAEYYRTIKNANLYDPGYKSTIARINKLEVNTVIPLLFDLFTANKAGRLSETDMTSAVKFIESFLIRRLFCGLTTSSLNKLFVHIGDEIERYLEKTPNAKYLDAFIYTFMTKTGKSRFPNDHEFDEKFCLFELYNAKSNIRKFIFERLENSRAGERVAVEDQLDHGELTIEHIMPQTLTDNWRKYLGDSWELIQTKYLHTIGNLTLTAYNSDYSNLPFDTKVNMQDKGIKFSMLKLNDSVKNVPRWNEEAINTRAKELLTWAKDIWQVPQQTTFDPNEREEGEWVSLEDDFDFTNKLVSKMILCEDEIITSNITDAYKKFCEAMYSLDPVSFKKVYHDLNPDTVEEMRNSYSISDIFIETNLSSQAKINIMKRIFERMGYNPMYDISLLVENRS